MQTNPTPEATPPRPQRLRDLRRHLEESQRLALGGAFANSAAPESIECVAKLCNAALLINSALQLLEDAEDFTVAHGATFRAPAANNPAV